MADREMTVQMLNVLLSKEVLSEKYAKAVQDAVELMEEKKAVFKPHYIDEFGKHFVCGVECSACHTEISSTVHYCPNCGRGLEWDD